MNGVTERGILISSQPDVQINSPGATQILAAGKDTGEFTVQSGNVPGKKENFIFVPMRPTGRGYPMAQVEIGKAGTSPELFSEWSGASLLIEEDAWWNSPWFGTFYASEKMDGSCMKTWDGCTHFLHHRVGFGCGWKT